MQKSVKGCVKIIYFCEKYFMLKKCYSNFLIECGTDEAGRGCLAGPVTAAAVILQSPNLVLTKEEKKLEKLLFKSINDSKQLSEKKRFELRPIIENLFDFSYIHINNDEIDEINILNASMKAMQESILNLNTQPKYIIVDGNRPLNGKLGMKQTNGKIFSAEEIEILKSIPNSSIIKGDANFLSIAAASVLAMASIFLLQQPLFWQKHTEMILWIKFMRNFQCIIGRKTKVIPQKNTEKQLENTELLNTTEKHSDYYQNN